MLHRLRYYEAHIWFLAQDWSRESLSGRAANVQLMEGWAPRHLQVSLLEFQHLLYGGTMTFSKLLSATAWAFCCVVVCHEY